MDDVATLKFSLVRIKFLLVEMVNGLSGEGEPVAWLCVRLFRSKVMVDAFEKGDDWDKVRFAV